MVWKLSRPERVSNPRYPAWKSCVLTTRPPTAERIARLYIHAVRLMRENKHWLQIKGPTSKFYDDPWYSNIEMLMGATGVRQTNTAHWYDVLEKSCQDPLGVGWGPPLLRLVPISWQDLLSRSTGGTRTRVRTPKKPKGEDTLSALEWGHSLGSWVRTLSLLLGEDTHSSASEWGHPLGSWVRTPTLHPFRRPIDDM